MIEDYRSGNKADSCYKHTYWKSGCDLCRSRFIDRITD